MRKILRNLRKRTVTRGNPSRTSVLLPLPSQAEEVISVVKVVQMVIAKPPIRTLVRTLPRKPKIAALIALHHLASPKIVIMIALVIATVTVTVTAAVTAVTVVTVTTAVPLHAHPTVLAGIDAVIVTATQIAAAILLVTAHVAVATAVPVATNAAIVTITALRAIVRPVIRTIATEPQPHVVSLLATRT
jgi:hypothetical protein